MIARAACGWIPAVCAVVLIGVLVGGGGTSYGAPTGTELPGRETEEAGSTVSVVPARRVTVEYNDDRTAIASTIEAQQSAVVQPFVPASVLEAEESRDNPETQVQAVTPQPVEVEYSPDGHDVESITIGGTTYTDGPVFDAFIESGAAREPGDLTVETQESQVYVVNLDNDGKTVFFEISIDTFSVADTADTEQMLRDINEELKEQGYEATEIEMNSDGDIVSVTVQPVQQTTIYFPLMMNGGTPEEPVAPTDPEEPEPEVPSLADLFNGTTEYQQHVDETVTANIPPLRELLNTPITFETEDGRTLTMTIEEEDQIFGIVTRFISGYTDGGEPLWNVRVVINRENVTVTDENGNRVPYRDLGSDGRYLEAEINRVRVEMLQNYPELPRGKDALLAGAGSQGLGFSIYLGNDQSSSDWPYAPMYYDVPLE
jgi:hypothetical protein